eukprot:TRINITY_DN20911_c0_g2_i1.p2 TRINITY_DN20911_c0_g2~~TRINITY_DN20911_c0_g2_i1.p2  ORF type:complete len:137 (+),score=18.30 TRINITY_DN20911_c0_g2_i1:244-654(+)
MKSQLLDAGVQLTLFGRQVSGHCPPATGSLGLLAASCQNHLRELGHRAQVTAVQICGHCCLDDAVTIWRRFAWSPRAAYAAIRGSAEVDINLNGHVHMAPEAWRTDEVLCISSRSLTGHTILGRQLRCQANAARSQ